MNKNWILYQTENTLNGKIYIGVHELKNTTHSKNYLGSGDKLKEAIKKYGKSNFTRKTLAEFSCAEEAFTAEAKIVTNEFVKREDTYNISLGGRGGANLTAEMKAKIGAANKNNKSFLGKRHTEETKAKLSVASKGRVPSEETRAKIGAAHKGKIVTAETRAKLSEAKKGNKYTLGKTYSYEVRARMSAAKKGAVFSEEHKAKLSTAHKGQSLSDKHRLNIGISKTGTKNHMSIPVIIDDVYYESACLAAKVYKVTGLTIFNRIKHDNPKWAEWRLATESEKLSHASGEVQ